MAPTLTMRSATAGTHEIEGRFRVVCFVLAPDEAIRAVLQKQWLALDPFTLTIHNDLVQYVRALAVENPYPAFQPGRTIGVAHLWVRDADGAQRLAEQLRSQSLRGLEQVQLITFPVRERFVIGAPEDYGQTSLRAVFLNRRRAGMSVEDFQHHWRTVHGPMVEGQGGTTRYLQLHRLPASYPGEPEFDGSAELSFPDFESYTAFMGCEPHHSRQSNDLPKLFDLAAGVRIMTRETVVF
jgi:uncharacterized protein (TIGR02118 family)